MESIKSSCSDDNELKMYMIQKENKNNDTNKTSETAKNESSTSNTTTNNSNAGTTYYEYVKETTTYSKWMRG